jgi:hypothetical protein
MGEDQPSKCLEQTVKAIIIPLDHNPNLEIDYMTEINLKETNIKEIPKTHLENGNGHHQPKPGICYTKKFNYDSSSSNGTLNQQNFANAFVEYYEQVMGGYPYRISERNTLDVITIRVPENESIIGVGFNTDKKYISCMYLKEYEQKAMQIMDCLKEKFGLTK